MSHHPRCIPAAGDTGRGCAGARGGSVGRNTVRGRCRSGLVPQPGHLPVHGPGVGEVGIAQRGTHGSRRMKACPLWIQPLGPSNRRSHLWPLKQLSRVEERRGNPAPGRVSGHLSGGWGEHQWLYAERRTAPSQLEAESSPISQLDALPCLGLWGPLAALSPFYAGATLSRRIIPAGSCNAPSRGARWLPGCRQPQAVLPVHSPSALSASVAPSPRGMGTSQCPTCLFPQ